ncbi:MAG: excisionase family DNA-binding protein [Sandaracinaceae bacterium]
MREDRAVFLANDNQRDLLTSTEAAELLGASPTSVKRWADEGILRCVRTAGRHRRFARDDLERFHREKMGAPPDEGVGGPDTFDAWLSDLLEGRPYRVQARLFELRSSVGSWRAVGERVGELVTEVGERWARGELSVVEEHLATERLGRALARVSETLPLSPDAPRALLLTPQHEEHTLGLSMLELALRELGWQPVWSGRRTPVEHFDEALAELDVQLVAASASAYADDPVEMARVARALADACSARGVTLLFGGNGAWPDPPPYGRRLHGFREMTGALPPAEAARRQRKQPPSPR